LRHISQPPFRTTYCIILRGYAPSPRCTKSLQNLPPCNPLFPTLSSLPLSARLFGHWCFPLIGAWRLPFAGQIGSLLKQTFERSCLPPFLRGLVSTQKASETHLQKNTCVTHCENTKGQPFFFSLPVRFPLLFLVGFNLFASVRACDTPFSLVLPPSFLPQYFGRETLGGIFLPQTGRRKTSPPFPDPFSREKVFYVESWRGRLTAPRKFFFSTLKAFPEVSQRFFSIGQPRGEAPLSSCAGCPARRGRLFQGPFFGRSFW